MRRKQKLVEGEWYHVYNRGVGKMNIYSDEAGYKRFLQYVYLSNSDTDFKIKEILSSGLSADDVFLEDVGDPYVTIGAYCLMPNHFHLLVRQDVPNGITDFMHKLSTAYAMYFNKKNMRVGPLFQGRFKAEHVSRDAHLNYLFSYIHLNPIKLKMPLWEKASQEVLRQKMNDALRYPYSSIGAYLGTEFIAKQIVDTKAAPWKFSSKVVCEKELVSWFKKGREAL